MRVGAIPDLLVARYENEEARKRCVMLEGPSGIGKSYAVAQAEERLRNKYKSFGWRDWRLAQFDPTDLRGVPSVVDGRTRWNPPEALPDPQTEPNGILFLDELSSAVPAVQAAAYQLILDRGLGGYQLPPGWMIVAAGNTKDDRGVTYAIPGPLRNRMTTLRVDAVLQDNEHHQGWLDYAAKRGCDPSIMAFLMDRADYLHKFDREDYGKPFPSPRAWLEGVSVTLQMAFGTATRVELLRGDVGDSAARDFETFLRRWEIMPSISGIFEDPDSVEVPKELSMQHCVVMGIAARVDRKTFDNAYRYLKRMKREFQTLCIILAANRDNDIFNAKSFANWAADNREVFKGD